MIRRFLRFVRDMDFVVAYIALAVTAVLLFELTPWRPF